MFARTGKLLLVLALMLSLGTHWLLLQSVAWMGMVVSYSEESTVTEAVYKTFSGKNQCRLCKVVEGGRADEKKREQQQTVPGSKLDLGVTWQSPVFLIACDRQIIPAPDFFAPTRSEDPPKPRPRHSFPEMTA